MTEKAKMLNGELYDSSDKQLVDELIKAKKLCNQYNNLCIEDIEKGNEIIKKLFSKTGNEFMIMPNFYCDYGFNIEIGEKFYSNHNLVILDANKVEFGDNVFIGPNCGFYTSGHPLDYQTRNKGLEYAKPIKVGSNVWIGGNVCVMPGVTIGDNVVIGAGSVVNKDIPSNCVAVGNPCNVIKKRFDDELIEVMEKLKWWDKSIEEINNLIPILTSSDLEKVKEELSKLV